MLFVPCHGMTSLAGQSRCLLLFEVAENSIWRKTVCSKFNYILNIFSRSLYLVLCVIEWLHLMVNQDVKMFLLSVAENSFWRKTISTVNICKSGPFVSAEGCKYQSVHLYPEIKVLMIELNVFYEKILFLTVYCNIPN